MILRLSNEPDKLMSTFHMYTNMYFIRLLVLPCRHMTYTALMCRKKPPKQTNKLFLAIHKTLKITVNKGVNITEGLPDICISDMCTVCAETEYPYRSSYQLWVAKNLTVVFKCLNTIMFGTSTTDNPCDGPLVYLQI